MIFKMRLEWTPNAGGSRSAGTRRGAGQGRRLLAFSKLSSHEGLSLGAPHFKGGEVSFYELDDVLEAIEAKDGLSFEDAFILQEAEKALEGAECIAQSCFLPLLVSYDVSYDEAGVEALVTAVVETVSLRPATVCATLKVDGFELLPSARIPLEAGFNRTRLRPVKLVRPKRFWSKRGVVASVYTMELELLHGTIEPIVDVRELQVWG